MLVSVRVGTDSAAVNMCAWVTSDWGWEVGGRRGYNDISFGAYVPADNAAEHIESVCVCVP